MQDHNDLFARKSIFQGHGAGKEQLLLTEAQWKALGELDQRTQEKRKAKREADETHKHDLSRCGSKHPSSPLSRLSLHVCLHTRVTRATLRWQQQRSWQNRRSTPSRNVCGIN